MEWQHPQFLYLILPVCIGWLVLALHSERRRIQAKEAFVAQAMWSRVLPESSTLRFCIKLFLRELAIITGLLALAGPRFGTQYEQVVPRGSDLYVLIDVSRSMLADDVVPSRLERAKADVSVLVNRLEGERIGLVAFAGQAVVKCPLTVDYDSFRRALNELDPNSAPRGGTAIGDAIRKALEVFHASADRDQALLLITDGDDQESYPLEAAAVAAERKVTIFTVGLGDSEQGSRIPQKANSSNWVEHEGQQVWSKLDGKLLQEIAIKTSGVYIPAGTRAYDLGELYVKHLQGRKGDDAASQQRIRRSEQFQVFLALTLLALLADLCISPYVRPQQANRAISAGRAFGKVPSAIQSVRETRPAGTANAALIAFLAFPLFSAVAQAGDSHLKIREGLKLYGQEQYEAAGKEFAAATAELDKAKSEEAAVAAFDEACAYHRQRDFEKARDRYLQAGLSHDSSLATSAHFNLGTMSAEKARELAGERPDEASVENRQKIIDELKHAVDAYRHCLELRPDHQQSRRNLELVRNWIKYYSDRWRELDRQKMRDESSLVEFLEFIVQAQTTLRETVLHLPENISADAFAELKRAQDELTEEIPTLCEKIESELRPEVPAAGTPPQQNLQDTEEGIALLQGWANKASDRMSGASRQLARAEPIDAAVEQKAAIEELDRIWDAVIPFHPLLDKELTDQTTVAGTLVRSGAQTESTKETSPVGDSPSQADQNNAVQTPTDSDAVPAESDNVNVLSPEPDVKATSDQDSPSRQKLAIDNEDLTVIEESQNHILGKARLLAPKAEAELNRLENMPAADLTPDQQNSAANNSANQTIPEPGSSDDLQSKGSPQKQADPEAMKAGYRRAIELAPKAVEEMDAALQQLRKKDRGSAGAHAEEARRILEEIQKAQPKNEQQQDQKNEDEQNDDKQQQDQKQDEQEKNGNKDQTQNEKKPDEQKSDQKKNEESKDEKKDGGDGKKSEENQQSRKQPQPQQVSQDRIEEALRKVRERQQEKRERDREVRARVLSRAPVDKDW